jgi:flagellar protein FlbD
MVKLTRLNNTILIVNADMIEFLETTPDTIVTLTTGRKVVVQESVDDVIDKVVAYKRRFMALSPEVRSR